LLGSVTLIMGMSFLQERKSERALEALRDSKQKWIPSRNVVKGDIIFLTEGDRVPADAVLFECQNMTLDESLLSGESVPVRKLANTNQTIEMAQVGGNDTPFVYSGSLVIQGKGKALSTLQVESSHLQNETAHAVHVVALLSIVLVIFLAVWFSITRGDWLNGIVHT